MWQVAKMFVEQKNVTEATEVTKKCDRSNKKDFKWL